MITFTLVDELSEVIHKHKTNVIQQMYVNDYSRYIYIVCIYIYIIICSYNIIQYSFHKTMFHQSLRSSCRIYLLPSGRGSRSLRSNAPPAVRRTGIMVHERQPQRDPDGDPGGFLGIPWIPDQDGSRWIFGATPIVGKQIRHLKVVQQMSHSTGVLTKKGALLPY